VLAEEGRQAAVDQATLAQSGKHHPHGGARSGAGKYRRQFNESMRVKRRDFRGFSAFT
jgi:hypothetical protein